MKVKRLAASLGFAAMMAGGFASVGMGAASAATTRPVTNSPEQAGLSVSASRVHYRYVQQTVRLPQGSTIPYPGAGLSVQLRAAGEIFVLGISTSKGSNTWNGAAIDLQPASCQAASCEQFSNLNSPAMSSGDVVQMSLYYSNGFVYYNITDRTTGDVFAGRDNTPGALFSSARAGFEAGVWPSSTATGFTAPSADYKFALLTNLRVTQVNGTRADLTNKSRQVKLVVDGQDQVDAPTVWKQGQNLGIWVRA